MQSDIDLKFLKLLIKKPLLIIVFFDIPTITTTRIQDNFRDCFVKNHILQKNKKYSFFDDYHQSGKTFHAKDFF